jgi:transitional endoplasmic reticulum ATPase
VAPSDLALRRMLADTLEVAGQWPDAVVERRAILSEHPSDPDSKLALARTYASAGQRGAAELILEELGRDGLMSTEGWRLRGELLGTAQSPQPAEPPALAKPPQSVGSPLTPGEVLPENDPDTGDARPDRAVDGPDPASASGGPRAELVERPKTTFADVGGMEALKESIRVKIIYPASHPEIYAAYGQKAGGGLLLYGPPGCGKTHLARATAGELGASFISVGIADILEMWIGKSERNLAGVFATARLHTPCVLFFDEIDALAAKRADFNSATGRQLINLFLAEFDGVEGNNDGILVLGATNAPWHVDPAFQRPGRFDEVLFVPPPDREARGAILRIQLRDRPVGKVDIDRLVGATDGYSGADIKGLVGRTVERKLSAALRTGQIQPLETADLLAAAKELTPTTREWFATVRNHVLYANQSGLYDAVRPYLR